MLVKLMLCLLLMDGAAVAVYASIISAGEHESLGAAVILSVNEVASVISISATEFKRFPCRTLLENFFLWNSANNSNITNISYF